MSSIEQIIGDYKTFLQDILGLIKENSFDFNDLIQLDHMGYRVETLDQYNLKKRELSEIANMVGETMVNDRPISTWRLHIPILFDRWRIDTIELPAPKKSNPYSEGLEHVEFVIYDDIPTFLKKYSDKTFEMRAADRGINPEVGFQLNDKYGVKFHLLNLPTVVYLENKLNLHDIRDGQ